MGKILSLARMTESAVVGNFDPKVVLKSSSSHRISCSSQLSLGEGLEVRIQSFCGSHEPPSTTAALCLPATTWEGSLADTLNPKP